MSQVQLAVAATRPARKLVPEHNIETSATCQLGDIYDVEEGSALKRMLELGPRFNCKCFQLEPQ